MVLVVGGGAWFLILIFLYPSPERIEPNWVEYNELYATIEGVKYAEEITEDYMPDIMGAFHSSNFNHEQCKILSNTCVFITLNSSG